MSSSSEQGDDSTKEASKAMPAKTPDRQDAPASPSRKPPISSEKPHLSPQSGEFTHWDVKGRPGPKKEIVPPLSVQKSGRVRVDDSILMASKQCFMVSVSYLQDRIGTILREQRVSRYYIGKSSIFKLPEEYGYDVDIEDSATWEWRAVRSRANSTYHDFDIVVVLCAATEAPPQLAARGWTAQQYTLALEQALIHHFALSARDSRCCNTTVSDGRKTKSDAEEATAPGHVVYLAFERKKDKKKHKPKKGKESEKERKSKKDKKKEKNKKESDEEEPKQKVSKKKTSEEEEPEKKEAEEPKENNNEKKEKESKKDIPLKKKEKEKNEEKKRQTAKTLYQE